MSTKTMAAQEPERNIEEMRKNARRNAILLGFVAFGFFLAFIGMSYFRG